MSGRNHAPRSPRGRASAARPARPAAAIGAVVALALAIAAGAAWLAIDRIEPLTIAGFVDIIRSWGAWGAAASIALMIIHSFVPFPAELVACANGMVYGLYLGTLITWTGAMLGASMAFALARRFGRPLVETVIARRNWRHLDDWTEQHGWKPLLISRFIPLIAFNLINYAAGLSRVGWWPFVWTTGIGILPLTVVMVALGDNVHTFGWKSWLVLALFAGLIWFGLRRFRQSRQGRSGPGGGGSIGHGSRS